MSEEITTHEAAEAAVEFGAESVESSRAIVEAERVMPADFAHNAALHYAKALRQHQRFADALFDVREKWGEQCAAVLKDHAEACLYSRREAIKTGTREGTLTARTLLSCEVSEAYFANAQGYKDACVDELYDAVAVLMRMIAVVEGKQKLGGEE